MSRFLTKPTVPLEIDVSDTVASLLNKMRSTGFQGRNLSIAAKVWQGMLSENVFIFMGLAGAMVPAGMRRLVSFLVEKRYVDCLVSTGANLFHDLHESLGFRHYVGSPQADDVELRKERVDRIHDVFASDKEFLETDRFAHDFARTLSFSRAYSTREFFYLLGEHVSKKGEQQGILSSAAKAGVPVYCPAVGDSSIGIVLSSSSETCSFLFDVIKDVHELAEIVVAAEATGVVYVGGGTPKNFIQQAQVTAEVMGTKVPGHKYGVQFIVDAPHWGGLSGCTFDEAKSWGKIAEDASKVTVFSDATIALPVLVTALAQMREQLEARVPTPRLGISGRDLQIVQ